MRRATLDDAPAMAALAHAGMAGYASFSPPGWAPPPPDPDGLRDALAGEGRWGFVEEDGRGLAGQTVLTRAQDHVAHPGAAGLAHLAALFVREDRWGDGLGARLLAAAVGQARRGGFVAVRLFVAEGQTRARRFYAREGWEEVGAPFAEPALALSLVEMRRGLAP